MTVVGVFQRYNVGQLDAMAIGAKLFTREGYWVKRKTGWFWAQRWVNRPGYTNPYGGPFPSSKVARYTILPTDPQEPRP